MSHEHTPAAEERQETEAAEKPAADTKYCIACGREMKADEQPACWH